MKSRKRDLGSIVAAALSVLGAGSFAMAAVTIDGSYSTGEGYSLVSKQINVTSSQSSDGGGPGGPNNLASSTSTGNFTNLSNVYAQIDSASNSLDLFIGGSMEEDNDSKYQIALQLNGNGVSSLAGKTINGAASSTSLDKIGFANGFAPSALFTVFPGQPTTNGTITMTGAPNTTANGSGIFGVSYTDLSSGHTYPAPSSVIAVLNNSLVNTAVGSGSSSDPGFANASTGLEISIPLSTLGYTPGSSIKALVFPTIGQDGRTDNQIIAPFAYPAGTFDPNSGSNSIDANINAYDYTYIDSNEGSESGRQFNGPAYANGPGYFTIPGVVPEPASLSLIGLAGMGLLSRRSKKA